MAAGIQAPRGREVPMNRIVRSVALSLSVGLLVAGMVGWVATQNAEAGKGGKGGGGGSCPDVCPRPCIACADVYDPVICSDGVVYGNSCYAYVACATGCVPYGDGGPVEVE
jgi:hypothetical protein